MSATGKRRAGYQVPNYVMDRLNLYIWTGSRLSRAVIANVKLRALLVYAISSSFTPFLNLQ